MERQNNVPSFFCIYCAKLKYIIGLISEKLVEVLYFSVINYIF